MRWGQSSLRPRSQAPGLGGRPWEAGDNPRSRPASDPQENCSPPCLPQRLPRQSQLLPSSQSGDLASLALSTPELPPVHDLTSWELLPHATRRPRHTGAGRRLPAGLLVSLLDATRRPRHTGAGRRLPRSACDQEAGAGPHTQQKGPGQWCSVEKKCSAAIQKEEEWAYTYAEETVNC